MFWSQTLVSGYNEGRVFKDSDKDVFDKDYVEFDNIDKDLCFSKMILMIDYANQNMVHKDFCLEDIVIVLKSNITIFSLKGRRHLKISLHCLFSRRSKNYANKVSYGKSTCINLYKSYKLKSAHIGYR